MRGPIDYIIVGFTGNNFKGEILKELGDAVDKGTIAVLDLAVIVKDDKGNVSEVEINTLGDSIAKLFPGVDDDTGLITEDDVAEVGDVLDNNCAAGLLIVEHVWAKGLKKAIIDANGVLLAEGRIHPDADVELNQKGA